MQGSPRKARDGVMLLIKFIREFPLGEALAASEQDKEKEDLVEKDEMPKHVPGNPRHTSTCLTLAPKDHLTL